MSINNEYHELIVCGKCSTINYRELEVKNIGDKFEDLDTPLNILIIRNYQCKCGEESNFKHEIVKKVETSLG